MEVRIDEPWQERAAGKIDDPDIARLKPRQRALIANRKHLAALDCNGETFCALGANVAR